MTRSLDSDGGDDNFTLASSPLGAEVSSPLRPLSVRFSLYLHSITFGKALPTGGFAVDACVGQSSACTGPLATDVCSKHPGPIDLHSESLHLDATVYVSPSEIAYLNADMSFVPVVNPNPLSSIVKAPLHISLRDSIVSDFVHDAVVLDAAYYVASRPARFPHVKISFLLGAELLLAIDYLPTIKHGHSRGGSLELSVYPQTSLYASSSARNADTDNGDVSFADCTTVPLLKPKRSDIQADHINIPDEGLDLTSQHDELNNEFQNIDCGHTNKIDQNVLNVLEEEYASHFLERFQSGTSDFLQQNFHPNDNNDLAKISPPNDFSVREEPIATLAKNKASSANDCKQLSSETTNEYGKTTVGDYQARAVDHTERTVNNVHSENKYNQPPSESEDNCQRSLSRTIDMFVKTTEDNYQAEAVDQTEQAENNVPIEDKCNQTSTEFTDMTVKTIEDDNFAETAHHLERAERSVSAMDRHNQSSTESTNTCVQSADNDNPSELVDHTEQKLNKVPSMGECNQSSSNKSTNPYVELNVNGNPAETVNHIDQTESLHATEQFDAQNNLEFKNSPELMTENHVVNERNRDSACEEIEGMLCEEKEQTETEGTESSESESFLTTSTSSESSSGSESETDMESSASSFTGSRLAFLSSDESSDDEKESVGAAIARRMREGMTGTDDQTPDNALSRLQSTNLLSSVTSEGQSIDMSMETAEDSATSGDNGGTNSSQARNLVKKRKSLIRLKSRKRETSRDPEDRPLPALTCRRECGLHTTIHNGGEFTEQAIEMDLPTRRTLTFWMIDGPNESLTNLMEQRVQIGNGNYVMKSDSDRLNSYATNTSKSCRPPARIGRISPLQKTMIRPQYVDIPPDYVDLGMPTALRPSISRKLLGLMDRSAGFTADTNSDEPATEVDRMDETSECTMYGEDYSPELKKFLREVSQNFENDDDTCDLTESDVNELKTRGIFGELDILQTRGDKDMVAIRGEQGGSDDDGNVGDEEDDDEEGRGDGHGNERGSGNEEMKCSDGRPQTIDRLEGADKSVGTDEDITEANDKVGHKYDCRSTNDSNKSQRAGDKEGGNGERGNRCNNKNKEENDNHRERCKISRNQDTGGDNDNDKDDDEDDQKNDEREKVKDNEVDEEESTEASDMDDDEWQNQSSLSKRRRYVSKMSSGESSDVWREVGAQSRQQPGLDKLCRRPSYDEVVNRPIWEVVHEFRPNQYVPGISEPVARSPKQDWTDLEESEDERLFRSKVMCEGGVTQKRLQPKDIQMADLELDMEAAKEDSTKAEAELVHMMERLEYEKRLLLEMLDDRDREIGCLKLGQMMSDPKAMDEWRKEREREEKENRRREYYIDQLARELQSERTKSDGLARENHRLLSVIRRLADELLEATTHTDVRRVIQEARRSVQLERAERQRLEKVVHELEKAMRSPGERNGEVACLKRGCKKWWR